MTKSKKSILVSTDSLGVNGLFYIFLKETISKDIMTDSIEQEFFRILKDNQDLKYKNIINLLKNSVHHSRCGEEKKRAILSTLDLITDDLGLRIYRLSLFLLRFRGTLLDLGKNITIKDITNNEHPLTKKYDEVGRRHTYYVRVNTALLLKVFFENISQKNDLTCFESDMISIMHQDYTFVVDKKVDPNQIFMIQMMESLRQSGVSKAGTNYENRIKEILIADGVGDIQHIHDENNSSLEYDMFFTHNNRTYGIGAKRSFRERYKQFTDSDTAEADVFITVTLGDDLNESKLTEITKNKMFVFVADEIYDSHDYMQNNKQVFKASTFNLATLETL